MNSRESWSNLSDAHRTTKRGPERLIYTTLVGSFYDSISKRGTVGVLCNGVRQGAHSGDLFFGMFSAGKSSC